MFIVIVPHEDMDKLSGEGADVKINGVPEKLLFDDTWTKLTWRDQVRRIISVNPETSEGVLFVRSQIQVPIRTEWFRLWPLKCLQAFHR